MEKRPYTEVVRLTGLLLDGEASPEQVDRLQNLLRESPVARFTYRATIGLHTALSVGLREPSAETLDDGSAKADGLSGINVPSLAIPSERSARTVPWRTIGIAAAAVGLVASAIVFSNSEPKLELNGGIPLTVTQADRAILFPNKAIHAGVKISGRDINILHGFAEFELPDGVHVSAFAPARIVMKKNFPILVKNGLVNFVCEGIEEQICIETKDTVIRTSNARVGLDVDARASETSVAVFQGSIEVSSPQGFGSDQNKKVLFPGDSSRYTKGKRLGIMPVVVRQEKGSNLLRASESSIVSEIFESSPDDTESRTYLIVSEGMKERRLPFIDRPDVGWNPVDKNGFPRLVYGADLVKTFQKDRWRKNFSLTMRFEKAAELYVLLDIGAIPPTWLTKGFERTGEQLRATPLEKGGAPFGIRYDIWKRVVQPGTVTLGRPYPLHQGKVTSMYGIAFRPL